MAIKCRWQLSDYDKKSFYRWTQRYGLASTYQWFFKNQENLRWQLLLGIKKC